MPKIQVQMEKERKNKRKTIPQKRKAFYSDTSRDNGETETQRKSWEIEETKERYGNGSSVDQPTRRTSLCCSIKVEIDADPWSSQKDLETADCLLPTSTQKKGEQKVGVKIKEEPKTTDSDHYFENEPDCELANQTVTFDNFEKQSHKLKDEASKDLKSDPHSEFLSEIAADVKHENQITHGNMMEITKNDDTENTSMDLDLEGSDESDSELPVHFQENELSKISGNVYRCGVCNLTFSTAAELSQHVLEHETDKNVYGCGLCRRVFKYLPLVTQHVLFIHAKTGNVQPVKDRPGTSKSYICDVCHKVFHRACDLSRHKKIHSDNKPFVCDVCSKVFCRMDNMNRHRKIHSTDRPYNCDECQKIFSTVGDLNQHRKVHADSQPFVCEVCSKGFIRFDKFDRHRKMHTGIRPFECDECGKTFITIADLLTHKKYHSGYKPFVCDVCQKAFYRNNDLNRHKTIHITNKRAKKKALAKKDSKQSKKDKGVTKCENKKVETQCESKDGVPDGELQQAESHIASV